MNSNRAYNTGLIAAMLTMLVAALVTGIALIKPYDNNGPAAHQSVVAITQSGFLGFLRSIHHWSSALLIVLGAAYIVVGLFRCAYRKPGQWLWIGSIVMFLIGVAMQLTGHLLPYDVQAVRTAVVETGIAANAPVVGAAQSNLMRGGETVGEHTLQLWYMAHVGIFAAITVLLLIALPLFARKVGTTLGRSKWIVGSFVVLLVMSILRPPLGSPASAADFTDQNARPEWYILPLHSLLVIAGNINPRIAFVGTMLVPGLAILILLALPFIHKREGATVGRVLGLIGAAGLIGLFFYTFADLAPLVGEQVTEGQKSGLEAPAQLDPKLVAEGKQLYASAGCDSCHRINGVGENIGPDLSDEGSKGRGVDWHVAHLRDPKSKVPGSTMPAFRKSDAELTALAQYVTSLKK